MDGFFDQTATTCVCEAGESTCEASMYDSLRSHPALIHGRSLMVGKLAHWDLPINSPETRGYDSPTMQLLALNEELGDWQGLALDAAVSAEGIISWEDPQEIKRFKEFLDRAQAFLG